MILERVRVHRLDEQAPRLGEHAQDRDTLGTVPRDVQRDSRRRANELEHDLTVFELFEHIPRFARSRKACEPRASSADAPRRDRHAERDRPLGERFDVDVATRELQPEMVVVVLKTLETPIILRGDTVYTELEPHLKMSK